MEPVVIMSDEFKTALQKELNLTADVIAEWRSNENNFELEDYQRYHHDLAKLLDWLITE